VIKIAHVRHRLKPPAPRLTPRPEIRFPAAMEGRQERRGTRGVKWKGIPWCGPPLLA
jgi:hypothetical protein